MNTSANGRLARTANSHGHTAHQCRWRVFDYDELIRRDKVNLDLFWLRDKSLDDGDDLPDPDVIAEEIADDLQTALDQFRSIAEGLRG